MTLRNELYTLTPRKRNIAKPYGRGPPEKITVRRGHSDFKAVLCRVLSNTNQLANQAFTFDNNLPLTTIWFAQHQGAMAEHVLSEIVTRISQEGTRDRKASVLFAVMDIDGEGQNPVYDALKALHSNTGSVFASQMSGRCRVVQAARKDQGRVRADSQAACNESR